MASLRLNTGQDVIFRASIIQMLADFHQDPNQVVMTIRWDRNDNLVWTFRSLPNGQTQVPGGGACHAEEVMLAEWGHCAARNNGRLPETVEMMITMTPCLDRSQQRQMLGAVWPKGCAQKLAAFIQTEPDTREWNISYFNAYQEDTHIVAQSGGAIALLSVLPRVDIYKFSDRHKGF